MYCHYKKSKKRVSEIPLSMVPCLVGSLTVFLLITANKIVIKKYYVIMDFMKFPISRLETEDKLFYKKRKYSCIVSVESSM